MSDLREWQQLPLTKEFAESLKRLVEDMKQQLVSMNHQSMEQTAIANIRISSEIKAYETIIEQLKEQEDDEQVGVQAL